MNSRSKGYLVWAVVLAEGLCGISALVIVLWKLPLWDTLADTLFFVGALLLVAGGLVDIGKSITFTHIRALRRSSIGEPPPHIEKSGRRYVLLVAGLLLCLQAALLVYLFPAAQP